MRTDGGTVEFVEDFLSHFGVKGMRWGQRKTETVTVKGKTKKVTPKKAEKLDKKWEKEQGSTSKFFARHNAMAEYCNSRIGALNDKYAKDDFSKEDFANPSAWSPRYKQYNKEVASLQNEGYRQAVQKVDGTSPTGKKKVEVETRGDEMHVVIKDIKHAEDDGVLRFKITRNTKGLIVEVTPVNDVLEQGALAVDKVLKHYGVKGMRWGRTTKSPASVSVTQKGKKLKTKGGEAQPAHSDAIRKATLARTKKKSGVVALSDKELQQYAQRLRLEQEVKRLESQSSPGRKFVSTLLGKSGDRAANDLGNEAGSRAAKKAIQIADKKTGKKKS